MTTQYFSISLGAALLLTLTLNVANATPVHLSGPAMDSITAGRVSAYANANATGYITTTITQTNTLSNSNSIASVQSGYGAAVAGAGGGSNPSANTSTSIAISGSTLAANHIQGTITSLHSTVSYSLTAAAAVTFY